MIIRTIIVSIILVALILLALMAKLLFTKKAEIKTHSCAFEEDSQNGSDEACDQCALKDLINCDDKKGT